ncbi:MAG TPA: hypothetical protein VKA53_11470 [Thermoanaerobaculia bacterium]|nr:hypothetical protein [Thermoanaerobaculia bacterium]
MMKQGHRFLAFISILGVVALSACASGLKPTKFINPKFNFAYVERVAVLPFANFSHDSEAGPRATRMMITELLATGAVDVVEPGEVQAALDKFGNRVITPSTEQIVALGKELKVQAVIQGSVTQSEVMRSGLVGIPVVSLDVHMIETDSGAAVWAASVTKKGSSLAAKILGTGGEPISETTQRAIRELVATLMSKR